MSDKLQQAITLIKSGDKQNGGRLLAEILRVEPRNEQAWLWMSGVVTNDEQRRYCLKQVLTINPNNQLAKKGLAKLQQKQELQPKPVEPPKQLILPPSEVQPQAVESPSPVAEPAQIEPKHLLRGFSKSAASEEQIIPTESPIRISELTNETIKEPKMIKPVIIGVAFGAILGTFLGGVMVSFGGVRVSEIVIFAIAFAILGGGVVILIGLPVRKWRRLKAEGVDPDEVEKNIRQMRGIFGFLGIVNILGTALGLLGVVEANIMGLLVSLVFGSIFLIAFNELGKRTKTGYRFAQIASVLLLLGFPILTLFGISYLVKLSRLEMKQALDY